MPIIPLNKKEQQRPRRRTAAEARESLRDQLWPGSDSRIWDRHSNQGFTTVPRLLSLVLVLIKDLCGGAGDASRVYLDLWFRSYDEGFINVIDDEELAYSSGYKGTRAARSWRERILKLQELGFIEVKPRGNTEVGYVLILNPLHVCARLNAVGKTEPEWWTAFVGRANEVGAVIPLVKPANAKKLLKEISPD
jgi:hypothetical protein